MLVKTFPNSQTFTHRFYWLLRNIGKEEDRKGGKGEDV
jgi:hypothetical protein